MKLLVIIKDFIFKLFLVKGNVVIVFLNYGSFDFLKLFLLEKE